MSERGQFRGGRGGGRGDRGGGARGGRGGAAASQQAERPKKENILDLAKYVDKQITVKFNGGREGWLMFSSEEKRREGGAWVERAEGKEGVEVKKAG